MEAAYGIRAFPVLSLVMALTATLVGAGPVLAQTAPAASRPRRLGRRQSEWVSWRRSQPRPGRSSVSSQASHPSSKGPGRRSSTSERTRSIHQPAFLRGAVKTVRTSKTSGVRVGLSGWTAPRVPFDSQRESSGGVAFGLTIEWGTPLPEPTQPAPPAQR